MAPEIPSGHRLSAVLVCSARAVCSLSQAEMAQLAGCDAALIEAIESLAVDPCLDTVERLVNAAGLEARYNPGPPSGRCLTAADARSEIDRLQIERAAAVLHRLSLGLAPLGPPAGSQSPWDGTEPAPPRLHGAGHTRGGPGKAAILLRYARARSRCSPAAYAAKAQMPLSDLQTIEAGHIRPTASRIDDILTAAGDGLHARLELYDDHDDNLHLLAVADPGFYYGRALKAAQ